MDMARNLMMIFSLCLAVAASGCFFEEAAPAGTDACIDEDDTALLCDPGFDPETCGREGGGNPADTSVCLQEDPGLSVACADCYGDAIQCTIDNCLGADNGNCANDPEGDDCASCRAENCDETFSECTGAVDCGTGGSNGNGGSDGNGGVGGNGGGGGNGGNGGAG